MEKNCQKKIRDYTGYLKAGQKSELTIQIWSRAPAGILTALPLKWLTNKDKVQVLEQLVLELLVLGTLLYLSEKKKTGR